MVTQDESVSPTTSGAGLPWILEHLLAYPGTYELPLRTMYTLNCASTTPASSKTPMTAVPGNAFSDPPRSPVRDQQAQPQPRPQHMSATTAAAQLRANLMNQISQLPQQPSSLPPAFITSFVRKCFPDELAHVDFPQALTAMDYLKDLEARRRAEIVAAFEKLGIDKADIANRDALAKNYPGVLSWIEDIEEKEKRIEAIYSQVYVGLRRWALINEMSLTPFNKANCIAMLNTLYPPMMSAGPFVQPTAQLTALILADQRNGFFRYITATERQGPKVLSSLMQQHKKGEETSGWPSLRHSLDNYLCLANNIIDECNEITGRGNSPTSTSFSSDVDSDHRRKVDSGISFSSGRTSNRSSAQSHLTRPSTSSSVSTHSHRISKDKSITEKPLPSPLGEEFASSPTSLKPPGSTLERIARELRKIRSRTSIKDDAKSRPTTPAGSRDSRELQDAPINDDEQAPVAPGKTLRLKRSLRKMRSTGGLKDRAASVTRPSTGHANHPTQPIPAFDAEEMKLRRQAWEEAQLKTEVN